MKKNTLFYLILSLLLFTACNSPKSSNQSGNSFMPTEVPVEDLSTKYYESLMNHFNENWDVEEPASSDYPEYFGGAYIDNNGYLVVCIVGNEDVPRVEIAKIIGSDNFKTETCEFSYREMMEVMDLIDNFLINTSVPEDHILIQNFAGAMADVLENRVVVNMVVVSTEVVNAFKQEISDSGVVLIQQGDLPSYDFN